MPQAYGFVSGYTGEVVAGSGNFTVSRAGNGEYSIVLQGSNGQMPVVVATPSSEFVTANVILIEDNSGGYFRLRTGYTDKPGQSLDCDFTFHAFW